MDTGEDFEEFVAIVDEGSVTAAAKALGLPRATMSRRLARLERRLGARLLHRTTRRIALTRQGEVLYPKARRIVETAREVEAEIKRHDNVPRGLLRVSTPVGVSQEILATWLVAFIQAHPEVRVEVVMTSVHVDLVAEGYDVALRAGPIEDGSMVARTLVKNRRLAVASPQYLAAQGRPEHPDQLGSHNCIVGYQAGSVPSLRWPLYDDGWVAVSGRLAINHMGVRLEAAKRHHGIALIVDYLADAEIACGNLEVVLPGVVGSMERVTLVYPDRTFIEPKVRAFVDFMVASVASTRRARSKPKNVNGDS